MPGFYGEAFAFALWFRRWAALGSNDASQGCLYAAVELLLFSLGAIYVSPPRDAEHCVQQVLQLECRDQDGSSHCPVAMRA